MSEQTPLRGAVFISYASQDAAAAARICEALRAAGVEVWFDRNELRGGDAWDAKIKRHIQECTLFIPVVSASTNARLEGYFRGEWNLATRRMVNMAHDAAFLMPVAVDGMREAEARVPEEFLRTQWTWLPGGETPPSFAARVRELLSGAGTPVRGAASAAQKDGRGAGRRRMGIGLAVSALFLVLAGAGFWYYQGTRGGPSGAASPAFAPPPHSVAVLAFTNLSGDADKEYFSDGLSEEILQSLAQIAELQVAARTSSFSFKGSKADIPTVGRKLNVGAVLEGSVRKAGDRVRVTAQLINAVTGFHMWSQNFDHEFKDVIALESEIAFAVASALEVRLLPDLKKARTPGGTLNAEALDAFMRGRAGERIQDAKNLQAALAALDEAVALDPSFANAHALRGDVLAQLAASGSQGPNSVRRLNADALQAANRAVALAPDSSFAYEAQGGVLASATSDYAATDAAYRRALQLAPGNAMALKGYASFAILMGRADALPAIERARELDPLNPSTLANLGYVQYYARKHADARKSLQQAMQRFENEVTPGWAALNEIADGHPAAAVPYCERDVSTWTNQVCLAVAYHQLDRQKDAEAMLKRIQDEGGEGAAFQYAEIYGQWGRTAEAMKWLEKAVELKDPGLIAIKVDPLLDPLRKIPRFQAIVDGMAFPA